MQRWRGVDAAPAGWGRSVVTIGVFDGVHRGHQQIIGHTVRRARELGLSSVVVTFDPHPSEVVRPGSHPAMLTEAGAQGRADRGARRRRALRHPVHAGVLAPVGGDVRPRRAGRAPARERGGGRARTSASATRRPATWRCWSGWAARSGSPWRTRRWWLAARAESQPGRVLDVHPSLRRRRRRRGGGPGAGPAAPAGGHRRARRPARSRARLPDREPAHRAARRGAGRRGLRGVAGAGAAADPSRCGRRSRSAPTRPSPAGSAGSRRTCSTSTAISTASGLPSTSWPGCGRQRRYDGIEPLVAQIDQDVADTRAALALTR